MKHEKLAVSIPRQSAQRVRSLVKRGAAASVSAYVARALENQLATDDLTALLTQMDEAYGPPTEEHAAWSRKVLDL